MTTTEQFRNDANALRALATDMHVLGKECDEGDPGRDYHLDYAEQLERIANNVEMMAQSMFTPGLQLEKRAEEFITEHISKRLPPRGYGLSDPRNQDVLLWLIYQSLKSGANKALLGQGLAGLGIGAAASLFSGLGKQPVDPDDK